MRSRPFTGIEIFLIASLIIALLGPHSSLNPSPETALPTGLSIFGTQEILTIENSTALAPSDLEPLPAPSSAQEAPAPQPEDQTDTLLPPLPQGPPRFTTSFIDLSTPATEDFETSFGSWINTAGDTCDWLRNQGTTPSSNTGPDHDHTTGGAGGWYAYVETSSGSCNTAGDQAILESDIFDGENYSVNISFWYHMYGANMGTLSLDAYNGTWVNDAWSLTGQQHTSTADAYTQAQVDLSSYTSLTQVRFRGTAAGSYQGDMAIDDATLTGTLRQDLSAPQITGIRDAPDPLNETLNVTLAANVTDNIQVDRAWVTIENTSYELLQTPKPPREQISYIGCEDGTTETAKWSEDANSPTIGIAEDLLECDDTTGYQVPITPPTGTSFLSASGLTTPDLAWYDRSVNLSGYQDVSVSFAFNMESTETADDIYVMYWDGASWTEGFHETDTQVGNGAQRGWTTHSFTVPDTAATETFQLQIRWMTSIGGDGGEHMMFDDINITGIPTGEYDEYHTSHNTTGESGTVTYTIHANDTSGNLASPSEGTYTLLAPPNISIDATLRDSQDQPLPAHVVLTRKNNNKVVYNKTGNTHAITAPPGLFKLSIQPFNHSVRSMTFAALPAQMDVPKIVDIEQGDGDFLFSINPSAGTGELSVVANSTPLPSNAGYVTLLEKCAEWNFTTSTCSGNWTGLATPGPDGLYRFNMTATDPGFREVVSTCAAEDEATKGTFAGVCDDTTGALLELDDGLVETHTYRQGASYGGVRIQSVNTSITNCANIDQVFFCYEHWTDAGDVLSDCDVSVDANGGASYTAVTTACPGSTANPGVTCTNVTSLETWTCSNFFGAAGTRAAAKSELTRTDGGPTGTAYWDVFYFQVNYTETDATPPSVISVRPTNDSIFNVSDAIELAANATDNTSIDVVLANITLPNGSTRIQPLTLAQGDRYNVTYIIPNNPGLFTLRYTANDTSGNTNVSAPVSFFAKGLSRVVVSVNQSTYAQGTSALPSENPGFGVKYYIPFTVRFADLFTGSPISDGTCTVNMSQSGTMTSLAFNASTGNYTGLLDTYKEWGNNTITAACSSPTYLPATNTTYAQVVWRTYLRELYNLSFGGPNNNLTSSTLWRSKQPSNESTLSKTYLFTLEPASSKDVAEFFFCGSNPLQICAFLKDYHFAGIGTSRLNATISQGGLCDLSLCLRISDSRLEPIGEICANTTQDISTTSRTLSAQTLENVSVTQGEFTSLLARCTATSNVTSQTPLNLTISYNSPQDLPSFEHANPAVTEVESSITGTAQQEGGYNIGPDATANASLNYTVNFTNTLTAPRFLLYDTLMPILAAFQPSIVPGQTKVYNSTGGLHASDNPADLALFNLTTSDARDIVRYRTEVLPGNTSLTELIQVTHSDALRDLESLEQNLTHTLIWNATITSIFTQGVHITNVTAYTNYSSYGIDDQGYSFTATKTNASGTFNLTGQLSIDTTRKIITFPPISLSSVVFKVTAKDKQGPKVDLLSPSQGTKALINDTITISANVTDDSGIDFVVGEILLPNLSRVNRSLTPTGTIYTGTFKNLTQKGNYTLTIIAQDSNGNANSSATTTFERIVPPGQAIDVLDLQDDLINYTSTVTQDIGGIQTLEVNLTGHTIRRLVIEGHDSSSTQSIITLEPSSNDTGYFTQTFLADFSQANLTQVNVTINATGNYLHKCVNVNTSSKRCGELSNYTLLASDLVPGQLYTFTLTAIDPLFGETLQGPANTSDAYMSQKNSGTNYGALDTIIVGRDSGANTANRGVIWFNTTHIPSNAVVKYANLSLYFYNIPTGDATGARTHAVHRVQQSPVRNWQELQVTWDDYQTGTPWTIGGGDYFATPTSTQTFSSTALNTYIHYNITADVQDFVTNGTNYGWILKDTDEATAKTQRYYYTSENPTAAQQPLLTIVLADVYPPEVSGLRPTNDSTYNVSQRITLSANVSDIAGLSTTSVDTVLANISYPNGTILTLDLVNSVGARYNASWTIPNQTGAFTVRIIANDTENNVNATETTAFNAVDLIAPTWVETPQNLTRQAQASFSYDVNATDNVGVASYSVNDTGRFSVNALTGEIVNATGLGAGVVWLNVSVNDTSGNELSTVISVTFADTVPPALYGFTEQPLDPATYADGQTYEFNSTATNGGGIDSVLLEFEGVNTSAVSVGNDQYSVSISALSAGTYFYRWSANDTSGNLNVSELLNYTVLRLGGEVNLLLNGTRANRTVNLGEQVNATSVLVNGTGNVELFEDGSLINNGSSPVTSIVNYSSGGLHNLTARYVGNENYTTDTETWYVFVSDTSPPSWNETPQNKTLEAQTPFYYDVNATDNGAINAYSLNDTSSFNIDSVTGVIRNATGLNPRVVWLNLSVNDTSGNTLSAIINITIADTIAPAHGALYEEPSSPVTYSEGLVVRLNSTWTDAVGVDSVLLELDGLNRTTSFAGSDQYNHTLTGLSAGTHNYTWHANDTSANQNSTPPQIYTINKAQGTLILKALPANTTSYGNQTTVNCTSNTPQLTPTLLRDGATVSNPDTMLLPAGSHNYTCSANGNQNYTAPATLNLTLSILRANSKVALYLNGTAGNYSVDVEEDVNTTAVKLAGEGDIRLYMNGSLIASDAQRIQNISRYASRGAINVTATYTQTQNYTTDTLTWYILVTDTIPPSWNETPQNISLEAQTLLTYDLNATDNEALSHYSVNDTSRFSVENLTGLLTNSTGIDPATYWLDVSANDLSGNSVHAIMTINVTDTISPALQAASVRPNSPQTYQDGLTLQFNSTWADAVGVDRVLLEVDGVNYTSMNASASLFTRTLSGLSAGTHNYTWHANDTSGNTNSSGTFNYTITAASSSLSLQSNTSSTLTYGTSSNVSCVASTNQITPQLYLDGNLVTSPHIVALPAGAHTYDCNATAAQNYTSPAPKDLNITINKTSSSLQLLLNSQSSNLTRAINASVNITAQLLTGTGRIEVFNNGTLILNGTGQLTNTTSYAAAGLYNITARYISNPNYTQAYRTLYVTIEPPSPPSLTAQTARPASGSGYTSPYNLYLNSTWQSTTGIDTVRIEFNGTNHSTTLVAPNTYSFNTSALSPSAYTYRWHANDTQGRTNTTQAATYTLNKGQSVPTLSITPSTSVTEGTQTSATCTLNHAQAGATLKRDGSVTASPDTQTLSTGTYEYECSAPASQNYTSTSVKQTLTVQEAATGGGGGGGGGDRGLRTIRPPEPEPEPLTEPTYSLEVTDSSTRATQDGTRFTIEASVTLQNTGDTQLEDLVIALQDTPAMTGQSVRTDLAVGEIKTLKVRGDLHLCREDTASKARDLLVHTITIHNEHVSAQEGLLLELDLPPLSVHTDKTHYTQDEQLRVCVLANNLLGPDRKDASMEINIQASPPSITERVTGLNLSAGTLLNLIREYDLEDLPRGGNYTVQASLYEGGTLISRGRLSAQASNPIQVAERILPSVTLPAILEEPCDNIGLWHLLLVTLLVCVNIYTLSRTLAYRQKEHRAYLFIGVWLAALIIMLLMQYQCQVTWWLLLALAPLAMIPINLWRAKEKRTKKKKTRAASKRKRPKPNSKRKGPARPGEAPFQVEHARSLTEKSFK